MAPRPSTVIESGPGHISSVMSPFHRISRSFAGLSPPVRAMLWMVLACFVFSILNALIRATSHYLHPFQVAFFRNLFGLAFMLPWLMRAGLTGLQTGRFQLYFWRVVIGLASMLTWFFALALLPFAQAEQILHGEPRIHAGDHRQALGRLDLLLAGMTRSVRRLPGRVLLVVLQQLIGGDVRHGSSLCGERRECGVCRSGRSGA